MVTFQDDLLEIYNNLLIFNDEVLLAENPQPIKVHFEKANNSLVFEHNGKSCRLRLPVYYCLGLDELEKPTYLLPGDYDSLMWTLSHVIGLGILLEDRTCLSPENYGFDIYSVNINEFWKGPFVVGHIRFVSGTSWLFKFITKRRFRGLR